MSEQVIPEPLFALDLIRNQLSGNTAPLVKFVDEKIVEASDLAIIDASMLTLLKVLEERARKFTNAQYLTEGTWRSIISLSEQKTYTSPELNNEWVRADTEEFLTEVVSPMVASNSYDLLLPSESEERGTADDEYLVHAFAVINVGVGFIRGVSATIPNYGDPTAIIGRLDEYFSLLEARGQEYEPFVWDEGR